MRTYLLFLAVLISINLFSQEKNHKYNIEYIKQYPVIPSDVKDLDAQFQDYKKLPYYFQRFNNIHTLNLGYNSFNNIPKNILKFSKLRKLVLKGNIISDLRKNELLPQSLKVLDLSENEMNSIDLATFQGLSLDTLILSKNKIKKIINSSNLPINIKYIELCSNNLGDQPGSVLRLLNNCKHIGISDNKIYDINNIINSLSDIQSLDISKNL